MKWMCSRCGKESENKRGWTFLAKAGTLCEDCSADLEEFLNGAPIIKWNPVKVRPITEKEREELREHGYRDDQIEEVTCLDGFIPEDSQEILISWKSSGGERYVEKDEAVSDGLDSWLKSGYDWKGVEAWAAMPEPYENKEGSGEE